MRPRSRFGSQPADSIDKGSATIWVLVFAAVIAMLSVVALASAAAEVARNRAESAADLAAVAAASRIGVGAAPCEEAGRIAAVNVSHVVSCQVNIAADGRSGEVRVAVAMVAILPIVGRQTVVAASRAERMSAPASIVEGTSRVR